MPGGIVTTGGLAQLLNPGLRKVYFETGKQRDLEFPTIFNVEGMEWNPQIDQQFSGLGTMPPKPQGTQFVLDRPLQGGSVNYSAVAYGMAFEVTWEMWRDDLYGLMQEMSAEMKRASVNRQEVQAASILNNAFDANFTGFDSTSLCSTAHVGIDGVTRSNRPAVDVSFSVTGLQAGISNFEGLTNERNLPVLMTPTLVVIDPANKWTAREILGSSGKPFTADNELNSLVADDLQWRVYHYLTTSTNWFLMASKGVHDLWFMWRDHPIFDSFDDPRTKNAVFTSYQRHTEGYGSYRGVYGSTG